MNRDDLLAFETFCGSRMRREADLREKRYPTRAAELRRWADMSDARADEIRCGPLFTTEAE